MYSLTPVGSTCSADYLPIALGNILDTYEHTYTDLLRLLSSRQKSLLLAIAREGKVAKAQSSAFIKRYKLTSASSVQSGLRTLMEKAYITEEGGRYYLYDLFLQRWIERRNFMP